MSEWWKKRSQGQQVTLIVSGVVLLLVAWGLTLPDEDSDGELDKNQPAEAKGVVACPKQMFVGLPTDVNVNFRNPGSLDYPSTVFQLDIDKDDFVVNRVSSDGVELEAQDAILFGDLYRAGATKAGDRRNLQVIVTPSTPGNHTIKVSAWASEKGSLNQEIEDKPVFFRCEDVPVNP